MSQQVIVLSNVDDVQFIENGNTVALDQIDYVENGVTTTVWRRSVLHIYQMRGRSGGTAQWWLDLGSVVTIRSMVVIPLRQNSGSNNACSHNYEYSAQDTSTQPSTWTTAVQYVTVEYPFLTSNGWDSVDYRKTITEMEGVQCRWIHMIQRGTSLGQSTYTVLLLDY